MSETIITKPCSKCKQVKPLSGFYKNRAKKDNLQTECKICCNINIRKYQQTAKGKEILRVGQKKYRQSRAFKEYQQSDKGKKSARKYIQKYSKSEKGKQTHKEYRFRNPEKRLATNAITAAVRAGKLPRPDALLCLPCFKKALIETAKHYHHYLGYNPKYWLDVIPVCVSCHYSIHHN